MANRWQTTRVLFWVGLLYGGAPTSKKKCKAQSLQAMKTSQLFQHWAKRYGGEGVD